MKRKLLAVFVLVGAAVSAYAHAVPPPPPPALTLTVSPATVPTGGSSTTILVEWSGIPNPMPGDWLGIYPAGVAPHGFAVGNPMWKYVDCQQHVGAGVQPVPAGVCAFDVSWLPPGHYQTSLLANEGMTELARAEFVVPPPLTLTVSPATVPAGESSTAILVEWSGIPNPMPGDWLAIYPAGVAPHGFAVGNPRWKYVDCQQHVGAGVQPVAAGGCTFDVRGLARGQYRASLLPNEGMTELASAVFTVEAGTPPPPPPPISDWDTHPEPALPPLPAAGGTLLDTVFGATIMRLTDANDGSDCRVEYSYWPTFNVDSTRVKALCVIGGVDRTRIWEFDPETFQRGAALPLMPQFPASTDPIWSNIDPDILYGYSLSRVLVSYNVVTQAMPTVKDFTSVVSSSGHVYQMSMSENDDRFAFTVTNSSWQPVGYSSGTAVPMRS